MTSPEKNSNLVTATQGRIQILKMTLFLTLIITFGLFAQSTEAQQSLIAPDSQQGQNQVQAKENTYTRYDGISWEKYVSYLRLNGTQGVDLPLDNLKINQRQSYTVMLWFKPQSETFGSRYQYAFSFQGSLQCYFTTNNKLLCDSIQKCEKLTADTSKIGSNQWTHIAVTGSSSFSGSGVKVSSLYLSQNLRQIDEDSQNYINLSQTDSTWKVCLGGCDGDYGFIGGLRDFVFLNKYLSKDTVMKIKNHYLLWDSSIVAYYRFSDKNFRKDEIKSRYAQISNLTSVAQVQAKDFIPNDICYPITETQLFYQFSQSDQDIAQITFDSRWNPKQSGWQYTFSVWLKIDADSCSSSNPYDARSTCYITQLQDSFMLFQPQKNQIALFFFNQKPFFELQTKSLTVPEGQWFNVQFQADQYQGYDLRVYDILGRLMSQTSEERDLQQQVVKKKNLNLLRNYEGLAHSLILYQSLKTLPLQMPRVSDNDRVFVSDSNCLGYFQFLPQSIKINKDQKTASLVNFCRNSQYGFLNATISNYPKYVGSYYQQFPYGGNATNGLTSASVKSLFDGIACNDGSKVVTLQDQSSFIRAESMKYNYELQRVTIEFWAKLNRNLQDTNYLFSLWAQSRSQEFMSIYYDKNTSNLVCQPISRPFTPPSNTSTLLSANGRLLQSNASISNNNSDNEFSTSNSTTTNTNNSSINNTSNCSTNNSSGNVTNTATGGNKSNGTNTNQTSSGNKTNATKQNSSNSQAPQVLTNLPIIVYENFNESLIGVWTHIACQYIESSKIDPKIDQIGHQFSKIYDVLETNSLSAYYYTKDGQESLNTLALNNTVALANDSYSVILGNNRNLSRGTPQLQIREVRVWPDARTFDEIKLWRYRQIDPRSYTQFQLMAYLRLGEGNYDEWNFANVLVGQNRTVSQNTAIQRVSYMTQRDLVVCPINTYYSDDYTKCYQDPVKQLAAAVYLYKDNDNQGQYYWVFDASQTILINDIFKDEIYVSWQFEDPIVNKIASASKNQLKLTLPTNAFRDEAYYNLKLNLTNRDTTFMQLQDLTFVPISCKYYTVNGLTAHSVFNNYTQLQASQDITFNFNLTITQPYCSNASFYNKLVDTITWEAVPEITYSDFFIDFDINNKDSSVQVTIPRLQQTKIPFGVEQKFIFKIFWENDKYDTIFVETQKLTFQNLIYTIQFNTPGKVVIPVLTSEKQIYFRDENVSLNATGTYITNVPESDRQENLLFSWVCQPEFKSICDLQDSQILNISFNQFLETGGAFNKIYTFTVIIQWDQSTFQTVYINRTETKIIQEWLSNKTTVINTTYQLNETLINQKIDYFNASIQIVWYNASVPSFRLNSPSVVKTTVENQFWIKITNYAIRDLTTQLSIQWSIVPNISKSLSLNSNKTYLTVPKDTFIPGISYNISVYLVNNKIKKAESSQQVTFTAQSPPYGGSISIFPIVGYVNETLMNITLRNWKSTNQPITFRVWFTQNSAGLLGSMLTDWIPVSQNFTFTPGNTYPYVVQITDLSGDIVTQTIATTIVQRQNYTLNEIQWLVKSVAEELPVTSKFSLFNSFVKYMGECSTDQSSYATQIASKEAIIDQISKDISVIDNPEFIDNEDSKSIIVNSMDMIQTMTYDSQTLNDYIATQALNILTDIQNCSQVFDDLVTNDQASKLNFFNSLSNLFRYSQTQQVKFNSAYGKRMLLGTSNIAQLRQFNNKVKELQNKFVGKMCSQMYPDQVQQNIKTDSFNLIIDKIAPYSTQSIRTFTSENLSKVQLNSDGLLQTVQNVQNLCASNVFHKTPIEVNNQTTTLTQYSDSIVELNLFTNNQLDTNTLQSMQGMISVTHKVKIESFKPNQTVCMGFQNKSQMWSSEVCETKVDTETNEIKCKCSMLDTQYQGVFTDSSRGLGESFVFTPESTITSYSLSIQAQSDSQTSFAFISILLLLLIISLGLPILSIFLDRRDRRIASQQLQMPLHQKKILKNISKISMEPIAYWMHKSEDVMNYSIRGKSMFAHMLSALHPLLNILTKYDVLISRMTRFSVYFLQITIFSILCVTYFGTTYRNDEESSETQRMIHSGLDQEDINNILVLGLFGSIILLPLPYSIFKPNIDRNLNQSAQVKIQTDTKIKSNQIFGHVTQYPAAFKVQPHSHSLTSSSANNKYQAYGPETTQEQQKLNGLPVNLVQTSTQNYKGLNTVQISHSSTSNGLHEISSIFEVQPKYKALKILILVLAYTLCVLSLCLLVYFSRTCPLSNQYSMIAAFYLGLFGSLFGTNILRVAFNTYLAKMIVNRGELKSCSIVVSREAIRLLKEIEWTKKAEKKYWEKSSKPLFETEQVIKINKSHGYDKQAITLSMTALEDKYQNSIDNNDKLLEIQLQHTSPEDEDNHLNLQTQGNSLPLGKIAEEHLFAISPPIGKSRQDTGSFNRSRGSKQNSTHILSSAKNSLVYQDQIKENSSSKNKRHHRKNRAINMNNNTMMRNDGQAIVNNFFSIDQQQHSQQPGLQIEVDDDKQTPVMI